MKSVGRPRPGARKPSGRAHFLGALASGELGREDVLDHLRWSPEFHHGVPVRDSQLGHSLHLSRSEFIIGLPEAKCILDLGGSSSYSEWGAMVVMGYPYRFESLTIIDLPPGRPPRDLPLRRRAGRGGESQRPGPLRLPLDGRPGPLRRRRGPGSPSGEAKGLNYVGRSLEMGTFSLTEAAVNAGIYAVPQDCYLLAYLFQKR